MNDDLEITYTTSRVDQDCRCCRCGDDDTITNMLKVVWGNDMTVSIKLAVKEDDQYVDYDLTDVEDMVVNVVSPYQDRIQVDSFITANKIQAIIDSNVLESNVPYGIELIWKDGPYDKRAFAKNMFMFVNSSIEATDSAYRYDPQNPYEYNIIMENDTCYISIGQIPEIDLSNYVTQGELTSYLDSLWQDCNDTFVDHEELADAISDLDLSDYVTYTYLDSNYPSKTYLDSNYPSKTYLDSNYPSYTYLYSYVGDAISGVTIDESNLVHKTGNEDISGTKHFLNRVLMNQGLSVSGNVLLNSGQGLLSQNVLELVSNSLQAARISSNQIATSDIIAPSDNYNNGDFSGTKDTITFYKDTNTSPYYLTLSPIAKIDSNGIYEGNTLLSDKYLQIADLPTIPTSTSELTNDSGFITSNDIPPIPTSTSELTNDSGFITNNDLTTALSNVVTSYDVNEIVCLTQSEYDALVQNQQLDPNTLYEITDAPSNFVTYTDLNTTLDDYVQTSALDDYVTQSSLESMSYIDQDYLDNAAYITQNDIPPIPNNVVTSDDGNEIVCLTQSQYDALEQNQQLESDVFYYITDTISNYVSQTQLNNAAYITQSALDSMGYITLNDIPTIPTVNDGILTIQKNSTTVGTFTANQSTSSTINISVPTDTSDLTNNGGFLTQSNIDQMGYLTQQNIDQMGYVSTQDVNTILNNASYVTYTYLYSYVEDALSNISPSIDLSSYVSYIDWDNTNEAIAQELTDNRLAHLNINNQFSYYYTKTESDSRYATQSWANNKFVTQSDDVNRQQAIAYAISYLNDNIGQGGSTPSNMVTTDTTQTITARKTFSDEVTFSNADQSIDFVDNASGIRKTGKMARGAFNQAVIGQIWAPSTAAYSNSWNCTNQVNTIKFQYVDANGVDIKNPTLHQLAKIDTTGIYEGTTLLANKYVQSSNIRNMVQISQSDYDTLVNNSQVDPNTLYVIV